MKRWLLLPITSWALVLPSQAADEPKSATTPDNADLPAPAYHIYAGSTHAHTSNTWSHGDHFINVKKEGGEQKELVLTVTSDGVQSPPQSKTVAWLAPVWTGR